MTVSTEHHRHLVAFPLALVLLVASVASGARVDASRIEQSTHDESPSGTQLIASPGLTARNFGRFTVQSLDGAFHVSHHSDALTVASLTTPVLVSHDTARLIVPVGWQWRSREKRLEPFKADVQQWLLDRQLQRLPRRFVQRQMEEVHAQSTVEAELPERTSELPLPLWAQLSHARLPGARAKLLEQWREEVLGFLRGRAGAADVETVHALVADPTYGQALQSERGREVVAVLLSELPDGSPLRADLLSILLTDPSLTLLLSVHPRWRDLAWLLSTLDGKEERLVRLGALPFADTAVEPVSQLLWDRWREELARFTSRRKDPGAFLSVLLSALSPLVSDAEALDYPQRARRLAHALLQLGDQFDGLLSESAEGTLAPLRMLDQLTLRDPDIGEAQDALQSPEVPPVPQKPTFAPEDVEKLTYDALVTAGAVFTIETQVVPVEPDTAEVRGIVFATSDGDQLFSFRYNAATGLVRNVETEGQQYPYELPMEAFGEWVRK